MLSTNINQRLSLQSLEIKEILLKIAHEQDVVMGAHGCAFVLDIVTGVKGEVVVGEDKLGKLDKELNGM